jgi:hypothetical protein
MSAVIIRKFCYEQQFDLIVLLIINIFSNIVSTSDFVFLSDRPFKNEKRYSIEF